jgi:predicted AlkP superfamily phosphohydrolase/phosphomutase
LDFENYYREIDEIIGEFHGKIEGREEFEIIMLSDHGFVSLDQEIYLNQILKNAGHFRTEPGESSSLDDIHPGSTAFALDPSRIFIHMKDRFPRGRVTRNDYNRIRLEIKKLFEEYKIGPKKVFKRAYFKEEIYDPDQLEWAADIVLQSNHGYDLKAGFKKKGEFGKTHFQGMHSRENAFFFTSRPELLPESMTIVDVKDHMFRLLGLRIR